MTALTRRRDPEARNEAWHVYYGDVHVGMIGIRSGIPHHADQWQWRCGFYPPGFVTARVDFETAWHRLLPEITDADLAEYRRERAWTAWKNQMWDAGCRLPTPEPSGRSSCFCGAEIDIAGMDQHVLAAHVDA
jgi:hypothetical protein